jgi:hypothetical protein
VPLPQFGERTTDYGSTSDANRVLMGEIPDEDTLDSEAE